MQEVFISIFVRFSSFQTYPAMLFQSHVTSKTVWNPKSFLFHSLVFGPTHIVSWVFKCLLLPLQSCKPPPSIAKSLTLALWTLLVIYSLMEPSFDSCDLTLSLTSDALLTFHC